MRSHLLPHAAALALALTAACSGAKSEVLAGKAAPAKSGEASAQEVAREGHAGVRCPARIATPARAAGAAVDDILGVRPGMTFEEAANLVLCSHDMLVVRADNGRGFKLETFGQTVRQGFEARFAKARVQQNSRQIMTEMQDEMMGRSGNRIAKDLAPGEIKWYITTMGMPSEERVIDVAREEWFAAGKNPTITSVEAAFIEKYGMPTRSQPWNTSGKLLTWVHDPAGMLLSDASPLARQCQRSPDPDSGVQLSPECGLVIAASVSPLRDNPDVAESMQVAVLDQAGGFQRLTATEAALQQQERTRQATQVKDAAKHGAAPKL
ncbi:MAG: hypothetical protein ABJC19_10805 [Gemmatimonadota bacterium]